MKRKLQKLQHCQQIKFIEVQLIGGYIDTNNLVQFVLNQNQEDQELPVQKKHIYLVKKRLDSNICRKSLRTMTKDFKSSHRTIKRIFNIDLNKKCYRKITAQSLKEDQEPIRKTCCQWIRKNIDRTNLE